MASYAKGKKEGKTLNTYIKKTISLSPLTHTWILDIDGTIVKHNGYIIDGVDTLLPNASEFVSSIPESDMIIFITSRKLQYREATLEFLQKNNIRYDHIIFEAPYGERILLNDRKTSGLAMSLALNIDRDILPEISINIDNDI